MASASTSVFRQLILRLSGHRWFRALATGTRPGRALASRFVAGETLDDAMRAARRLDRARITSMLDHLGENAVSSEQASNAQKAYLLALERFAREPSLDCAISLKLTQLGLDHSVDACVDLVRPIVASAVESGAIVMVDMESHEYVDATLDVIGTVHEQYPRVGVALQSYLRRTAEDVFRLPAGLRVRLVKGSYLEPPDVVFVDKSDVDESYGRLFATLFARGHAIDVATHDPRIIERVRRIVDRTENGWSRVEFQMLYGVRRALQAELARQGYPVRVYVPYGTEWYPYLTRRLAERPANVWFFVSNVVRGAR